MNSAVALAHISATATASSALNPGATATPLLETPALVRIPLARHASLFLGTIRHLISSALSASGIGLGGDRPCIGRESSLVRRFVEAWMRDRDKRDQLVSNLVVGAEREWLTQLQTAENNRRLPSGAYYTVVSVQVDRAALASSIERLVLDETMTAAPSSVFLEGLFDALLVHGWVEKKETPRLRRQYLAAFVTAIVLAVVLAVVVGIAIRVRIRRTSSPSPVTTAGPSLRRGVAIF